MPHDTREAETKREGGPDPCEPISKEPSLSSRRSALGEKPSRADVDFLYEAFLRRGLEDERIYDDIWSKLNLRQCVEHLISSDEYKSVSVLDHINVERTIFFRTSYDFLMPISLTEPLTLNAYLLNEYEKAESDFVRASLAEGDVAIDLGARHGWFTGIMAAAVGPHGKVYSFEPMPPRAGVRDLVEINDFKNVVSIDSGVSDSPGTRRFDGRTLTMSHVGTRDITLTTLDAVVSDMSEHVKLIKADIEGAEALAFKGGRKLLERCLPTIIFEVFEDKLRDVSSCSTMELLDWLRSCGYRHFRTLDGVDAGDPGFNAGLVNLIARS